MSFLFRVDFIAMKCTANIVHDYGTTRKYETTFAFRLQSE